MRECPDCGRFFANIWQHRNASDCVYGPNGLAGPTVMVKNPSETCERCGRSQPCGAHQSNPPGWNRFCWLTAIHNCPVPA